MTSFFWLLAAVPSAILPSDRLAMADRLFAREAYPQAIREYQALRGVQGIASDELLMRLAECARAENRLDEAEKTYRELITTCPNSRHVPQARLLAALTGPADQRLAALKALDADSIPKDVRAAALYHRAHETREVALYRRALEMCPEGPYAVAARYEAAVLELAASDATRVRTALGELIELSCSTNAFYACESLRAAAGSLFAAHRYREAATLGWRFEKTYPQDPKLAQIRRMGLWSEYLSGRYTEVLAHVGGDESADAIYLTAASRQALGDKMWARRDFEVYLKRYPDGSYAKACELTLARLDFDAAVDSTNRPAALAAALRAATLSSASSDRLRLGWAYERADQPAEARTTYEGIARDFPKTDDAAEALFRKAMMDISDKRWSAAEMALAESLSYAETSPHRAEAFYWRGFAAQALGHHTEAARFLSQARAAGLSLDQAREADLLLADMAYRDERWAEAKSAYARLVRDGATARMSAAKLRFVGRFLSGTADGEPAWDEVRLCARALLSLKAGAAWNQAAYALEGRAAEAVGEYTAALEAYRQAFQIKLLTDESAEIALSLGGLEQRAGNYEAADRALKEAVRLLADAPQRRAEAYWHLAENAESAGRLKDACAYATVVVSLFESSEFAPAARRILAAHPEMSL